MSSIKALDSLSGNLSSKQEITGDLSVTKEYDAYSGPYEITPKAFESQMLETKNRVLRANLEITEVPYWETVTVPIGYHDGSGTVQIDATEQEKIIAGNIKEGVELLGVKGSLKPSSLVTAQSKTVTPSTSAQTILPDVGTDYLSQVTVAAIPYVETANTAGGTTITIAG